MKYSFAIAGLILFGMFGIVFIVLFENVTINNESEYYVLKEAVQASMYESIDIAYYRETGKLKIIEEKFVANCTRRFASSISGSGEGYQLTFYDIMESPPKVSVVATSKTSKYRFDMVNDPSGENKDAGPESYDINNAISAILEFNPDD